MICTYVSMWRCDREVAGGTHPMGRQLCGRHLAALLAPLVPPARPAAPVYPRACTDASVSRSTAAPLEPELVDAIVALAPLGATYQGWYPHYEPRDVRMPCGVAGDRFRVVAPDDTALPSNARSTMRRATAAGWACRATVVDADVLVKCQRDGELLAFTWADGAFVRAWRKSTLEPLGLRAAQALL